MQFVANDAAGGLCVRFIFLISFFDVVFNAFTVLLLVVVVVGASEKMLRAPNSWREIDP